MQHTTPPLPNPFPPQQAPGFLLIRDESGQTWIHYPSPDNKYAAFDVIRADGMTWGKLKPQKAGGVLRLTDKDGQVIRIQEVSTNIPQLSKGRISQQGNLSFTNPPLKPSRTANRAEVNPPITIKATPGPSKPLCDSCGAIPVSQSGESCQKCQDEYQDYCDAVTDMTEAVIVAIAEQVRKWSRRGMTEQDLSAVYEGLVLALHKNPFMK